MRTAILLSLTLALGHTGTTAGELTPVPSAELHLFFTKQPIAPEGTVLVPLDAIEKWLLTQATRTGDEIRITRYGETQSAIDLRLKIGSSTGLRNGAEVALGAAPRVIDKVTYVPLRFIAEAVGVWVESEGHRIHLQKPDLNWECWLAIPPDPRSLEGKMVALAVAQKPDNPKRVELIDLSADTMSGTVVVAQPGDSPDKVLRQRLAFSRDKTGWHLSQTVEVAPPVARGG
jgi:hypothetical protein